VEAECATEKEGTGVKTWPEFKDVRTFRPIEKGSHEPSDG
jgi:hypothetical protein